MSKSDFDTLESQFTCNGAPFENRYTIMQSSDAAIAFFDFWEKETVDTQESFYVMILNNANHIVNIKRIALGTPTACIISTSLLLRTVLVENGVAFICAHNHPSGKLRPSQADKDLTEKLKKAAKAVDLTIMDHVIISPSSQFFSFADEGYM